MDYWTKYGLFEQCVMSKYVSYILKEVLENYELLGKVKG